MVLLDMFMQSGVDFFVLNIEHGIRAEQSIADSAFVKDFCRQKGIECFVETVDAIAFAKAEGIGLEQAARILRHRIFKQYITEGRAEKVALAHHKQDAAESVLMHILRGCGLEGLSAMSEVDGHIIRPLLSLSRQQIDDYAKQHNVPFRVDATNLDAKYSRNFIRLELLPKAEEKYPNATGALLRLSHIAKKTLSFLDGFISKDIAKTNDKVAIPCTDILREDIIADLNIKTALDMIEARTDFEACHYTLIKQLAKGKNGARLALAGGFSAIKEYDKILICKTEMQKNDSICGEFKFCDHRFDSFFISIEKVAKVEKDKALYIDKAKIPTSAIWRYAQKGDSFKAYGGGTKSLGDYFTDKKIPLRKRGSLPLLCDGSKVLLIGGVQIADEIKCGSASDIYRLTISEV